MSKIKNQKLADIVNAIDIYRVECVGRKPMTLDERMVMGDKVRNNPDLWTSIAKSAIDKLTQYREDYKQELERGRRFIRILNILDISACAILLVTILTLWSIA